MFQSMAYWGPGGEFTWTGFWIGAFFSYLCCLLAVIFMLINKKSNHPILVTISILLIIGTLLWTTFIIIAWQSGM